MGRAARYAQGDRSSVSDAKTPKRPATQIVEGGRRDEWTSLGDNKGGIVNTPVWRASTILYDNVLSLANPVNPWTREVSTGKANICQSAVRVNAGGNGGKGMIIAP